MSGSGSIPAPQLMYFPRKQYSSRFGKQFFTMEVKDYQVQDVDSCLSSYAVFSIAMQQEKFTWEIHRRFSDFDKLLQYLRQKYGNEVEFPQLPPKTFLNVCTDPAFLDRRKLELDEFSNHLLLTASKFRLFNEQKLLDFYGLDPNFNV